MSITILFKGGRLPSWHALTRDQQKASEQEHVDLMLGIAHRHRMMRLEGFRLMAPQDVFQRFWLLEFPDFADVQAWIDAEMAPSYGRHGYYEYHLSHQIQPAYCTDWGAADPPPVVPLEDDPHTVPPLLVDQSSGVVRNFERNDPGVDLTDAAPDAYIDKIRSVALEGGLIRLECFALIAPNDAWHRLWLAEFPSIETAEAWIEAEVDPAHGRTATRVFHFARKWAPEYFTSWIPRE